jgi:hypothetical protein
MRLYLASVYFSHRNLPIRPQKFSHRGIGGHPRLPPGESADLSPPPPPAPPPPRPEPDPGNGGRSCYREFISEVDGTVVFFVYEDSHCFIIGQQHILYLHNTNTKILFFKIIGYTYSYSLITCKIRKRSWAESTTIRQISTTNYLSIVVSVFGCLMVDKNGHLAYRYAEFKVFNRSLHIHDKRNVMALSFCCCLLQLWKAMKGKL